MWCKFGVKTRSVLWHHSEVHISLSSYVFVYVWICDIFCSYWILPNAKSVETASRPYWHYCIIFKEVKDVLCKVTDLTFCARFEGTAWSRSSKAKTVTFWPLTTKFSSLTLREYFAPESEESEIPSWCYCPTHKYWMDSPAQRHRNCTETIFYFSTSSVFKMCRDVVCSHTAVSPPPRTTHLGSQQAVRGPTLPEPSRVKASSSQFRQQSWR